MTFVRNEPPSYSKTIETDLVIMTQRWIIEQSMQTNVTSVKVKLIYNKIKVMKILLYFVKLSVTNIPSSGLIV